MRTNLFVVARCCNSCLANVVVFVVSTTTNLKCIKINVFVCYVLSCCLALTELQYHIRAQPFIQIIK